MTWSRAWDEGRTPWDAGSSPPVLVELVEQGRLPGGRTLVPGCGSGYDVLTLATADRDVTGLEIAPRAIARFEALRADAGVPAERARIVEADFFTWRPPEENEFDLIWDYTFLCAIPPDRRTEWVERVDTLLAPHGELVTLIFPDVDRPPDDGPPYPMNPARVRALLEPRFEATEITPVLRSHPSRQGHEWLARWRRT